MKYLIRRGLIDVWYFLLLLAFFAFWLLSVYAIADLIIPFWALLISIKVSYYLGALTLINLIRFTLSLVTNWRRADYVSRHYGYPFEKAAKIIGIYPRAFEYYDLGQ